MPCAHGAPRQVAPCENMATGSAFARRSGRETPLPRFALPPPAKIGTKAGHIGGQGLDDGWLQQWGDHPTQHQWRCCEALGIHVPPAVVQA